MEGITINRGARDALWQMPRPAIACEMSEAGHCCHVARYFSTVRTVWVFVLAGCVPGCAGASSPKGSLPPSALALGSALPPDPQLEQGPWHAPMPVPHGANKLAWAGTYAPSPCRTAINTGPVIRVDSEVEFESLFCRRSNVDWPRQQLFWYRLAPMSSRALLTEDVVVNDSLINWLIAPEPCPDRSGASASAPVIVIARSDLPVVVRPMPDVPADCPVTGDGYGY